MTSYDEVFYESNRVLSEYSSTVIVSLVARMLAIEFVYPHSAVARFAASPAAATSAKKIGMIVVTTTSVNAELATS